MEQNTNYYQQNWNLPPEPPQKNNRWKIWVVVALLVVGLFAGLIYGVVQLGKSFGNKMNQVASSGIDLQDSLDNKKQIGQLLAVLSADSLAKNKMEKLKDLDTQVDSIYHLLNFYFIGFQDTLGEMNGISAMDQKWGRNYFIKTGRAWTLKKMFLKFREESIQNLPIAEKDSSLYSIFMIDELGDKMPGFMKKFADFENLNFNQPVFSVKMNFSKFKTQIGMFEQAILSRWSDAIDQTKTTSRDSAK